MMVTYYPVVIALIVLGYAFLRLRLNRIAQPLRLRLADCGEELLADQSIPNSRRKIVEFELNSAFGSTWTLIAAFLIVPFAAIWYAFAAEENERFISDAARGRAEEFDDLASRVGFLNHPVLLPALYISIALWFIPALLASALAGKAATMLRPPQVMAAVRGRLV